MAKKIYIRFVLLIIITALMSSLCGALAYYALFEKQVHQDMQVTAQIFKDTSFFRKYCEQSKRDGERKFVNPIL